MSLHATIKNAVLVTLAFTFSAQVVWAQAPPARPTGPTKSAPAPAPVIPKGNGKINGVVIDESAKKPVEFATVSLLNQATNKPVDGALTDNKGRFSLTRVAAGQYRISVSFLGYETKVTENITIGTGKDEVSVSAITLKLSAKSLQEVAVTGEKALVEDKVDRLVYNAEKDLTNTGGNAGDVLKKVPGLTVDLDGNVQLRGSGNVRVLINNKPSTIMAASMADALRQIPSDQIKTVEVITSPGAKYDAEGTAGIINIITKKNNLQGVNGNLNASYGQRKSGLNGNVNYRKGKLGLNTALGQGWRNNPAENSSETNYRNLPGLDRLSQNMDGKREGVFTFMQLGADYDISKKSSLAAGARMQAGEFAYKTTQTSSQFLRDALVNKNTRRNSNEFDNLNYDINLDFTQQFAKPGQELAILGLLSRNNRQNYGFADVYNQDMQLALREQNLNDAYNEEKTVQADYTHPFKNKHILEVGAKAILRYAESDFRFLTANGSAAAFTEVPRRSDELMYRQNVGAAYATYGFNLQKKYNIKLGGRYETTQVNGDFVSDETEVNQNYGNFIPSIAISRSLPKNQTLKFNYTKRIQRPQLGYLNPFQNRMDTFNIQTGNPELNAELTNAYEFGYSTFFKSGTAVNASVFWRQTNNAIQAYTVSNGEGVNFTNFGNIGQHNNYGINLFSSTKFLKKGNLSGNATLFYADLESGGQIINAANASMMYNANLNASYTFAKGLSAQAFGAVVSRRVTLQGKSSGFATYNFAVKKDINKNASVNAGIDNPFSKTIKLRNTFSTPNSGQDNTLYLYARQVRLSASYKFGKTDFKNQPRRRKKISNDDAKTESDNNGQ